MGAALRRPERSSPAPQNVAAPLAPTSVLKSTLQMGTYTHWKNFQVEERAPKEFVISVEGPFIDKG
jgi:hypothetical protein